MVSDQHWITIGVIASLVAAFWFVAKWEMRPGVSSDVARDDASGAATEPEDRTAGAWKPVGWVLTLLGALGAFLSFNMETTIEHYAPPTEFTAGGASQIANLDLMFQKGVAVATSLSAIGIGVFCLAVGSILNAIHQRAGNG